MAAEREPGDRGIEGSYASVIGGAPAAGVVFAGEVDRRTRSDTRVAELEQAISGAAGTEKAVLRGRLAALLDTVRAEKLGEVAAEFDSVHNVQRALRVGSIHRIIPAADLRPYLIEAVRRAWTGLGPAARRRPEGRPPADGRGSAQSASAGVTSATAAGGPAGTGATSRSGSGSSTVRSMADRPS